MILCNNLTRVVSVPTKTGDINLIPGNNSVSDADFNYFKDHPSIKAKLDKGEFTVGRAKPVSSSPKAGAPKSKKEEPEALADLKDMSKKDAIKTIEGTFDLNALKEWRKGAKGKIKSALDAQIKEVETKG